MLAELERDVASGTLYRSKRLTDAGWVAYPDLLREAARHGDDATLAASLAHPDYWFAKEQSTSSKGKVYSKDVPYNANETLAESEFNRFYLRGLCVAAGQAGIPEVLVYRAKEVEVARSASIAMIGKLLDASALLHDLRESAGVDTALGLPPGPNSGLSGKFAA